MMGTAIGDGTSLYLFQYADYCWILLSSPVLHSYNARSSEHGREGTRHPGFTIDCNLKANAAIVLRTPPTRTGQHSRTSAYSGDSSAQCPRDKFNLTQERW